MFSREIEKKTVVIVVAGWDLDCWEREMEWENGGPRMQRSEGLADQI